MTPAELSRTVLRAVRRAVEDGVLRVPVPDGVRIERPGPGGCGDYATTIALRLAGPARMAPLAVAGALRERIAAAPGIASVEITGPGFLNISLAGDSQSALVRRVLDEGLRYGHRPGGGTDGTDGTEGHPPGPPVSRAAVWDETVHRIAATQAPATPIPGTQAPATRAPATQGPGDTPHTDRHRTRIAAPVEADPADLADRVGHAGHAGHTAPAIGPEALRWSYLSAAAHDRPRPGPHLLRQHESNPLFTVRYAHSRSRALTRNAAALGFAAAPLEHIDTPLDALIADYPDQLASAARHHAPDRLVRHLEATADALLAFQHTVLPVGEEKPTAAHRSRLALAEAAGTVLAGGLSLLGISAPEHL
ncbi:ArgS-related anticodon-binding protein NrtL [Streptomyces yaizuensis]|uniref:arginine--tRNA ligase n=1 Tax=Streptomyces yaizuensis TaxID=2989713 RepID=A0ABQ5NWC4_9ACTN|nr:DALR anticodon-binding domain-containing protein [Streptomyces sp. YSPA8]GLF94667.1 arginine--tRNA ligase [Streptomyces sp. YSPA8]